MKYSPGEFEGAQFGSEHANRTADCGSTFLGQVFGTSDFLRCCELVLLSVAIWQNFRTLNGAWAGM